MSAAWSPDDRIAYLGGRFSLSAPVAIGDNWTLVPFDTVSPFVVPVGAHLDAGDVVFDEPGVLDGVLDLSTTGGMMVSGLRVRFVLNPDTSPQIISEPERSAGLAANQSAHVHAYCDVVDGSRLRVEAQIVGSGSVNVNSSETLTSLTVTIRQR